MRAASTKGQIFHHYLNTLFLVLLSLEVVACACDRATTELVVSKGLRSGLLSFAGLCRSGGVNMVNCGDSRPPGSIKRNVVVQDGNIADKNPRVKQ